ncbi:MAG: bifunctional phosphoribosylaminoimidazolecarboxamide formyltransferase/IMP cyclohydrolase [Chitinophagales bacterium]
MHHPVAIKTALISVFYKDKLDHIVEKLHALGVQIYSTGGTYAYIESLGIPVTAVEDLTEYPSILGGRVKTLHPKVFGGILARRDRNEDNMQISQYHIPTIDLVIVDLYPFEETVHHTVSEEEIIEKIDIGGVSLIRAAAKNYRDVLIIASKDEYPALEKMLDEKGGVSELGQRTYFAKKAFALTSHYDDAIYTWFNHNENHSVRYTPKVPMRYGENPHQSAAFYGRLNEVFEKLHGKDISYNNLVDIESAVYLMEEFADDLAQNNTPTFAILKHTNTCGLAAADTLEEAYERALAADPVSAFGGVLICNNPMDAKTAFKINSLFFEVLIAPSFEHDALTILKTKKNRILLQQKMFSFPSKQFKSMLNGMIVQDRNQRTVSVDDLMQVTDRHAGPAELRDLLFAEKAVKHVKSNGIALVKNRQLIGIGTGQTSRVDALMQAIAKARSFGFSTEGAVMASEAFFPFPDCVEIADQAGITAVIQPGGSVRDKESIDYCNAHNMAMCMSGIRHFKHG